MTDKAIKFRLAGIETLQFAVFPEAAEAGEIGGGQFQLDFEVAPDEHIVTAIPRLSITAGDETVAVLEFAVDFHILDEDWPLLSEDGKIVLPVHIAQHFATIAVGTGRGIFHEKLQQEGTFRDLVWPLVDITRALVGEVVLEAGD